MAGHSKWANIKHRKARVDAKKGTMWSKCSKAIIVAAKHGGGDPTMNLALRYAIDEAKAANMPKDNIERAIKKGAGDDQDANNYEDIRYEGYGVSGVAVIVDCLTDNRKRTAPEMREIFSKHGGNLGATGCVSYMFQAKGIVSIEEDKASEDKLMELALEAGAEDVAHEEGYWTVTCEPTDYLTVKDAIESAGIEIASSELTMLPDTPTAVSGNDVAKVLRLVDALEDNDDVQKVYTSMDASDEDLEAAMG